eukprot:6210558-Pleurochrysis_carterae.AAC.1
MHIQSCMTPLGDERRHTVQSAARSSRTSSTAVLASVREVWLGPQNRDFQTVTAQSSYHKFPTVTAQSPWAAILWTPFSSSSQVRKGPG